MRVSLRAEKGSSAYYNKWNCSINNIFLWMDLLFRLSIDATKLFANRKYV